MKIEVLLVEERRLVEFAIALDNVVEGCWEEDDFLKASNYAYLMTLGEIFPPIIVRGRTVDDGHHRLFAYRKLQRYTVEVIDLITNFKIMNTGY
jgi:hypothetical protein